MSGDPPGPAADPHPASAEVSSLGAGALADALAHGELTSAEVVDQLVARIEALDAGPGGLRSVLELAPDASAVAARLDAERRAGRVRSALHGVPVLVKDNVDTVAPLHTTAGSFVFGTGSPGADAALVGALRAAGALVLGKANLSEWANFRSRPSSSGWSAVGGQTRNPHALDRSPGGSSSGSAAAVAARFAPLAVGTETDGSILCPSAACGCIGLKPTLGLVSRTGIVPIAFSQDTAGPIARSAADAAMLLEVLADAVDDGEDERATRAIRPAGFRADFVAQLRDGLAGVRFGVVRDGGYFGYHPPTDRVFDTVLDALRAAGADVVDPAPGAGGPLRLGDDELTVLTCEFKDAAPAYFARRRASAGDDHLPRALDDVLAHARSDPRERTDLFGTELIEASVASAGVGSAAYAAAREASLRAARGSLDAVFSGGIDVVVVPAMPPAWLIDHVLGDQEVGAGWSAAAVAGYPSATVPVALVHGLPVGVALLGPPFSEGVLLRAMAGIEAALGPAATSPVPAFAAHAEVGGPQAT